MCAGCLWPGKPVTMSTEYSQWLLMNWHLYILRTASGMLYTGVSTDPERRLQQHESGKGARSLRGKGPLRLEFRAPVGDRSSAQALEARVKRLSRSQKEELIIGVLALAELPGHS